MFVLGHDTPRRHLVKDSQESTQWHFLRVHGTHQTTKQAINAVQCNAMQSNAAQRDTITPNHIYSFAILWQLQTDKSCQGSSSGNHATMGLRYLLTCSCPRMPGKLHRCDGTVYSSSKLPVSGWKFQSSALGGRFSSFVNNLTN